MSGRFEELDYQETALGELILRRREVVSLDGQDVYEVKLDGEFLMSSLVNEAEIALATIALDMLPGDGEADVLVGGLGLGYTARAALDHGRTRTVTVIEHLAPVLDWHRRRLVPLAAGLVEDPRCRFVHADFFAVMAAVGDRGGGVSDGGGGVSDRGDGVSDGGGVVGDRDGGVGDSGDGNKNIGGGDGGAGPPQRYHAILLDIDHSPEFLLRASHGAFYTPKGLGGLRRRLHDGGVFALWSAEAPAEGFLGDLGTVFKDVGVHRSAFWHPLLNREDANYIITAC